MLSVFSHIKQIISTSQVVLQSSDQDGKIKGEISIAHHSRRPNLPTLQIPARTLEIPLPSARSNVLSSPGSVRAGLPPRPISTRAKSSIRSLFPQRSLKTKNSTPGGDRTVLLIPGTPSSQGPQEQASTSRQFFITKVLSSTKALSSGSTKQTHSLPVTPVANCGPSAVQERHVIDLTNLQHMWFFKLVASHSDRVWQDVPVLVMVSMLAYFCFLEQLLVRLFN
ncbi:hypothetical protein BHM03_00061953 [Ensete ventricosum]|nr:hypothetical protein BHM03_00061953 [Ensete ventricosum]